MRLVRGGAMCSCEVGWVGERERVVFLGPAEGVVARVWGCSGVEEGRGRVVANSGTGGELSLCVCVCVWALACLRAYG